MPTSNPRLGASKAPAHIKKNPPRMLELSILGLKWGGGEEKFLETPDLSVMKPDDYQTASLAPRRPPESISPKRSSPLHRQLYQTPRPRR